jgi:hypothetical protein
MAADFTLLSVAVLSRHLPSFLRLSWYGRVGTRTATTAAAVRIGKTLLLTLAAAIASTCGGGSNTAPSGGATVVPSRTLTVTVFAKNRLNNAVESDVTIAVSVGNSAIATFKGDKNPWSYTAKNVATSTQYRIDAIGAPDDYAVNGCTGDLSADVNCTIILLDTLVPPPCDANLLKYLYRPKRFEGLNEAATPMPRCETTWGVVRGSEAEHDADAETWVQPTKQEAARLFSSAHGNFNAAMRGLLLGEWICRGGLDDIGRSQGSTTQCDDYKKYVAQGSYVEPLMPNVGDSGVFVGFLVFDCGHSCWTELHPLVWWHKLLHAISPDSL